MAIMDTYRIGGVTGKLVRQVDKDTVVLYDGKNNIEVKIPKGQEPKKGLKACSNCKKEQSITNFKRYKNGNYTSMCEKCRKMVYKANKQPKIKPEPTKVEGEILKVPSVEKPVDKTDKVNNPAHYDGIKGLTVRTVQENFVPKYEKYGVMIASDIKDAIKYILRAPNKNGLEDLRKSRKMLDYAIGAMEVED